MDGFFWPLVLIAIGMLLLSLELFIPSAGALGLFAGLALLAAVLIGFFENVYVGASSLMLIALLLPAFLAMFVRWYPDTPLGRRMLLRHRSEEIALRVDDEEERLRALIGRRGRAKTTMLPSGAVTIDGQTYDASTEGLAVEPGQPVEVIGMNFHRLIVRPVENDATPLPTTSEDVLAQPAENLGISPFEDPLI